MIHGERQHHTPPCYARTTRLCPRRCCPRPPPVLALARLCISVIRLALYTRLCRTTEGIWRTICAPQTVHTHTHIHTYTSAAHTNIQAERRIALRSLVWGRGSRHGTELRSLSSSLPHRSLPPSPSPALLHTRALDFGIPPSRRLGTFRFFPREGTTNRPATTGNALCAPSVKVQVARCRHVLRANGIDFRCATRRAISIRSCRE